MSKIKIEGKVIKGRGVGSKIGIPTANIKIDNHIKFSDFGVYFAKVLIKDTTYNGAIFIGSPLTFDIKIPTIEVTIIDFDDNIYNENIKIEIKDKIRNIKKFDSIKKLKKQIDNDINEVKKIIKLC